MEKRGEPLDNIFFVDHRVKNSYNCTCEIFHHREDQLVTNQILLNQATFVLLQVRLSSLISGFRNGISKNVQMVSRLKRFQGLASVIESLLLMLKFNPTFSGILLWPKKSKQLTKLRDFRATAAELFLFFPRQCEFNTTSPSLSSSSSSFVPQKIFSSLKKSKPLQQGCCWLSRTFLESNRTRVKKSLCKWIVKNGAKTCN